jgi:hypothetical protein
MGEVRLKHELRFFWSRGKTVTKQASIAGYKSGKSKTEPRNFAPMNVKVLGNVALMRDSDREKNISCGKYLWMEN